MPLKSATTSLRGLRRRADVTVSAWRQARHKFRAIKHFGAPVRAGAPAAAAQRVERRAGRSSAVRWACLIAVLAVVVAAVAPWVARHVAQAATPPPVPAPPPARRAWGAKRRGRKASAK